MNTTWAEAKEATRKYNCDNYKPDTIFDTICDCKQTGIVSKYLNDIDRHNIYLKTIDNHLINIVLNGSTSHLRQATAN